MARGICEKDNMLSKEIRYKKTEKGMMITEYYGNDSYVVLPDEIEGEPVTILGDYAFSRNLSVEEIWMPLELKEVGRYAFLQVPESEKISTWQQTSGYGRWCAYRSPSGRSRDISFRTEKKELSEVDCRRDAVPDEDISTCA